MSARGGAISVCDSICRFAAQIASRSITGSACSISPTPVSAGAGIAAGPELISVSDRSAEGSASAAARVTSPPNEWPTRCAGPSSPASTARTSSASTFTSYDEGSSVPGDSYCPRWSIASTSWPAAASGARTAMKSSLEPV